MKIMGLPFSLESLAPRILEPFLDFSAFRIPPSDFHYALCAMRSALILWGHFLELRKGEDRAVFADVLIADIASAAHTDTTFHAHLQ